MFSQLLGKAYLLALRAASQAGQNIAALCFTLICLLLKRRAKLIINIVGCLLCSLLSAIQAGKLSWIIIIVALCFALIF
jgi:hypothetical protein